MSGSHNVNLKPDSLEGKHIDPVGFLASQKTPEDKRKVKSVDIQLDVLKNELEPDTTSNVRCEVTEDEDRKNLEDKKVVDSAQNNQPQENKESSKYFDHAQSSSTKKSIPTCPCEESVENYLNVRDSTEEPIVDKEKKNEAVNVRENTEEPLVDKEKKDQATQGVDSTSVRSNSVSETSRHTDSSENDFVGTKCKDAQVTLPYTAVNVRENTEEPLDDKEKKNKAVNVRENTEGPLVDKKKKDQATPGVDSTSVRSNSVSETSRHTDSSKNDFVGTKCEDAQVTLPYKAVNVRKSTEEPLVDKEKKNKAVNVRENTEEPLVDKEKKDQATPGVDSTSVRSKRVSDTSRHTDSSENDYVGTKCEDAQVTLPYPDKNGPPECIAKLRNAGLYDPSKERTELDVVKNELKEPDATSNVRCEVTDEDRKDLEDKKKDVDSAQNNQPPENKETSNYFDQGQPSSQKPCKIKSNPTCLCKECVENCLNVRVNTEGPLVDKEKKNKAVNVRENTEGPLVDKEKKVEATPGVDRTSVRNRRVSDTSRHTDSSENDFVGTKCEDAQVTLPYPDKKGPPECIARLSNAGLYDPSEERTGKTGNKDKISQVAINTSVFVKQPALEKQRNVQKDECDKVDIEKGDPERETLICHTRTSVDQESVYPGFCQCHKACLKLVGSFVLSMLIFPAFLFAAYAWLPFDAPLIPDVPTRLVYTLRCSTFASFPIVLGVIVHGISRLCASSYNPFKPREREVTIHRRFVKQSTFLFVLYFFNLSVLATYLPQKHLKFIPLLTCLFSLSQLIYWLSFAVGRSFRGFGYGLTFLPLVVIQEERAAELLISQ